MIFNLNTTSIYLQGYSGNIYFADAQGDFVDIEEKILIIQPFQDQVKLETMLINNTDARFIFSNGDFDNAWDTISTGYSLKHKNIRKSMIKFDNLEAFNGKKLVKAYLHIAGKWRYSEFSNSQKEVFVHRIEEKYGEITKWDEMPFYNPEPCASTIVGEYNHEMFSWDITSLFKGWIDNTYPNYGLLLKGNDPIEEESNKEFIRLAKPPHLIIIYFSGELYKPKLN